jgi:hypothetical protein
MRQDSYESSSGTGGYTGPTPAEQGTTNGAAQANNANHDYITSNATTVGTQDGNSNGSGSITTGESSQAETFWAQPAKFDTPQAQEYIDAYQQSYKTACTPIYNAAYDSAYTSAYSTSSAAKQKADDLAAAKKSSETAKRWWLVGGAVATLYAASAIVLNYKDEIVTWWNSP